MKRIEIYLLVAVVIIGLILIIQNIAKSCSNSSNNDGGTIEALEADGTESKDQIVTYLTVNEEDASFARAGGSYSIDVNTDAVMWSVASSPSWVTASGEENRLLISCDKNRSGTNRTGEITLTAGDKSAVVFVSQTGEPTHLSLSTMTIKFPRSGGDIDIDINTDAETYELKANMFNIPDWDVSFDGYQLHVRAPYRSDVTLMDGSIYVFVECNGKRYFSTKIDCQQNGACPTCKGSGRVRCFHCNGMGKVEAIDNITYRTVFQNCRWCNGTRYNKCTFCNGTGEL